jgi:hypothetical protein
MPSPKTWSPRRGDAEEKDALPSGSQRRENTGECETVESMARTCAVPATSATAEAQPRRRRHEPYLPTSPLALATSRELTSALAPMTQTMLATRWPNLVEYMVELQRGVEISHRNLQR